VVTPPNAALALAEGWQAAMSVEVIVPDGCLPGDQFLVETDDGGQFNVTVPLDAQAGMAILVDLPLSQHELVDVEVPDGCFPGDQFVVEHGDQQFNVIVPDGLSPGMMMQVEVPSPDESGTTAPEAASGAAAPSAAAVRPGRRGVSMSLDEGEKPEKKAPLTLSLGLIGGLELNLSLSACAKYKADETIEVYRTDGTWSIAKVNEFDDCSFTYTIELEDGRLKYCVEEEDIQPLGKGKKVPLKWQKQYPHTSPQFGLKLGL